MKQIITESRIEEILEAKWDAGRMQNIDGICIKSVEELLALSKFKEVILARCKGYTTILYGSNFVIQAIKFINSSGNIEGKRLILDATIRTSVIEVEDCNDIYDLLRRYGGE